MAGRVDRLTEAEDSVEAQSYPQSSCRSAYGCADGVSWHRKLARPGYLYWKRCRSEGKRVEFSRETVEQDRGGGSEAHVVRCTSNELLCECGRYNRTQVCAPRGWW